MDQINVFMVGSAGSGKTYLSKAFSEWLDFKKLDNIIVNLDPGAEKLPYTPDIDIRDWFNLSDIMEAYGVGPNGAQILGADLISTKINEINDEIVYQDAQYVIIDTPGQMELFTLRHSSEIIIDAIGRNNSVMTFLFDPIISKTPSGYLSLLFLSASAYFRLKTPQILVLSKSDVLEDSEVEKILSWSDEPEELYNSLTEGGFGFDLFHLIRESGLFRTLFPISSTDGIGMEDLYDGIQELFFGGEDLEKILF